MSKLQSKIRILQNDLKNKGLRESIAARIIKHSFTHTIYNLFLPDSIIINGHKMYIDKHDTVISRALIRHKIWEPMETKIFYEYIKPGHTVVDIGAQIGYYTLIASKLVGPTGKVFAFEPDPRVFKILKKNLQVNHITNVTAIQKAVSNRNASSSLYINHSKPSDNQIFPHPNEIREKITVKTISLDSYIKNERINFIKIDIQGAEYLALNGMKNIIKRNQTTLVTEFWPRGIEQCGTKYNDLLDFLSSMRFEIYQIDEVKNVISKTNVKSIDDKVKTGLIYDTNLLCIKKK